MNWTRLLGDSKGEENERGKITNERGPKTEPREPPKEGFFLQHEQRSCRYNLFDKCSWLEINEKSRDTQKLMINIRVDVIIK